MKERIILEKNSSMEEIRKIYTRYMSSTDDIDFYTNNTFNIEIDKGEFISELVKENGVTVKKYF